jgi:hypothetical protein
LVDVDIPQHRFEEFRKSMEDAAWSIAHTWKNAADVQFVQANEVPAPIPARGTREDYARWSHSPEVKS